MKKLLISIIVFSFVTSSSIANADSYLEKVVNNRDAGIMEAQQLVQEISNNDLDIKAIDKIDESISGIGILSNTKNKVYGSAFVVDDYTLLTNNHVVEKGFGTRNQTKYDAENVSNLKFMPSRNGSNIPYVFNIKDIKMIKGVDVAIVHTKEKLTDKVKPLEIANEKDINDMKFKDRITTYGYPAKEFLGSNFERDNRYKLYKSEGFYIRNVNSDDPQFYSKLIIRKGNSGSPILNNNNKVIGINPGGMNNTNANITIRGKNEMAYAVSFIGYVKEEVDKYRY
ncbi:trypsin-like serine peptidase [Staphylococcus felis]|uniref:trypsin-like serine peptidase n=1 Tax=Staphylococcus felis TaxID=46127 RepID=UPI000CCFD823|nr:trypsin-like serine protease [Staphylococcus felis]AVP36125.1 serine protease [Staphylococcus felis]PNZ36033.1 hypothetical protein CD143_04970 [Staphylococcus felis]QQB03908.1 trypsin-like peptidase domain-containing protein [Staphylococcus felis]